MASYRSRVQVAVGQPPVVRSVEEEKEDKLRKIYLRKRSVIEHNRITESVKEQFVKPLTLDDYRLIRVRDDRFYSSLIIKRHYQGFDYLASFISLLGLS